MLDSAIWSCPQLALHLERLADAVSFAVPPVLQGIFNDGDHTKPCLSKHNVDKGYDRQHIMYPTRTPRIPRNTEHPLAPDRVAHLGAAVYPCGEIMFGGLCFGWIRLLW